MFSTLVPLFPGIPGGPEVLIILAIIVILFGANKIPKLAGSIGQAQGEFEKGRIEAQEEIERMRDMSDPSEMDTAEGDDSTDTNADRVESSAAGEETTTNTGVESEVESETRNTETDNTA